MSVNRWSVPIQDRQESVQKSMRRPVIRKADGDANVGKAREGKVLDSSSSSLFLFFFGLVLVWISFFVIFF